jgi:HD-GYP domain-containing protein (c-di-GMP phosphodiesterase class II)
LLEARIVAVADVVESIASHRPYRPTLGLQAAIDEIKNNRGTLYDALAVDACLEILNAGFEFT